MWYTALDWWVWVWIINKFEKRRYLSLKNNVIVKLVANTIITKSANVYVKTWFHDSAWQWLNIIAVLTSDTSKGNSW